MTEVSAGLNNTSLHVLATARWPQQNYNMPVAARADLNMPPPPISRLGILERANLDLMYPSGYK
eukprot:3734026-Pyramimonas_sp.AAC.1